MSVKNTNEENKTMRNKKLLFFLLTLTAIFISSTFVFAAKYEYDKLGRLTKVEYDSEQTTKSVSYSYDAGGNIKAVSGFMAESVTEISTESTSETTTEDIDDIYNYIYLYDLNGKDISDTCERATDPTL